MAKVNDNLLLEGLSGKVGDKLVLKRIRGGRTILCKKPTFGPDRKFSNGQLDRQQAFREATDYAGKMKRDPVYLAAAEGTTRTGYNVAMSDWLNPPQVLKIDLSCWNGVAGDLIRVRVQDDFRVAGVRVEIRSETGTVLEAGAATEAGASWWEYRTNQPLAGALIVTVFASDMPGHVTQVSREKTIGA